MQYPTVPVVRAKPGPCGAPCRSAREAPRCIPRTVVIFPNLRQAEVVVDRLAIILARLGANGASIQVPGRLCQVAAEVVGISEAGVMVLSGDLPQASLCTTGTLSALIEELQYTLGEGPSIDAHRSGAAVSEPDLGAPQAPRWPAFSPKAVQAGARAVFGFPLRIGAARVGSLNFYRDRPGRLSGDQHADALVMADLIAHAVLAPQARDGGRPGSSASVDADIHAVVHQAAGMVSSQLDISVGDALARLRAHAFATDRRLSEVADDVVGRRLRLDDIDGA
jgi:hypothetical protein